MMCAASGCEGGALRAFGCVRRLAAWEGVYSSRSGGVGHRQQAMPHASIGAAVWGKGRRRRVTARVKAHRVHNLTLVSGDVASYRLACSGRQVATG